MVTDQGVTQTRGAALSRTAKLYTAMAPFDAAPLMEALDDETAVEILRLMTTDEAATILSFMEPGRGARLMAQLAAPDLTVE
jgi:flagellar motility protein MotE (MotC chaperone)